MGRTHLGAPGPPGATWWVVVPTWVPSLISSHHIITYLQKTILHLSVFWERGSPDLPTCGPRRGSARGPVRPIFINKAFKTLARGEASRGG